MTIAAKGLSSAVFVVAAGIAVTSFVVNNSLPTISLEIDCSPSTAHKE
jgi:hypothetical protein